MGKKAELPHFEERRGGPVGGKEKLATRGTCPQLDFYIPILSTEGGRGKKKGHTKEENQRKPVRNWRKVHRKIV